jgi:hypothetical protein
MDADDEHFLFANESNTWFPKRQDLLCIEVGLPGGDGSFYVMVCHTKARAGGRANTDYRREGASRKIIDRLEADFDGKPFILLGDFNDTPDDRSLNILETGDPNAPAGPEEIEGPFLINLAEPLYAAGHVSWGRNTANLIGNHIDTIDPQARDRNNNARGTNDNTGDALFDQLLIPAWMHGHYVQGSAKVFDYDVAVLGNNNTRASDHLPVYADSIFGGEDEGEDPVQWTDGAHQRGRLDGDTGRGCG